jgi:glutathione S-transferase
MLTLVIGNKNYSSWSLRAWLFLQQSGLPFEEVVLPLGTPQWGQQISRYSPAGKVPVLLDGELAVWDTLAIFAHLQERFPMAVGWPAEAKARAVARSVSAEMHAGFLALRGELPQNIRARKARSRLQFSASCQQDIERIEQIWADGQRTYGGPWLFGDFSVADVMYAPVALRFVTYGITLSPAASSFVGAVQALPAIQRWAAAAAAETHTLDAIEQL